MADDDDYMSEAFLAQFEEAEKASKKNMTYTERRRQKEKEHLANQIKSHREREQESRVQGLETELGEENKGMQMLLKMGFKKGGTLGSSSTGKAGTTFTNDTQDTPLDTSTTTDTRSSQPGALKAPLAIEIKQGRSGLGMDTLRRQQEEQMFKEKQAFDNHFRERKGDEYLQDKYHRQLTRAQSLCMELDTACFRRWQRRQDASNQQEDQDTGEQWQSNEEKDKVPDTTQAKGQDQRAKRNGDGADELSRGNMFWWISDDVPDDIIGTRAMGRPAELSESSGEADTVEPGSKRPHSAQPSDEEQQDSTDPEWQLSALKKRRKIHDNDGQADPHYVDASDDAEQASPEERPPLWGEYPEFANLEVQDKRDKVVGYLRSQHAYCFWCHAQYDDQDDLQENCPGPSEDDH